MSPHVGPPETGYSNARRTSLEALALHHSQDTQQTACNHSGPHRQTNSQAVHHSPLAIAQRGPASRTIRCGRVPPSAACGRVREVQRAVLLCPPVRCALALACAPNPANDTQPVNHHTNVHRLVSMLVRQRTVPTTTAPACPVPSPQGMLKISRVWACGRSRGRFKEQYRNL